MNSTPMDQSISDHRAMIYVALASLTILIYDTSLTFSEEIKYIWRRNMGLGSILYLIARYFGILEVVFDAGLLFVTSPGSSSSALCNHLGITLQCFHVLAGFGVQGLIMARGYIVANDNNLTRIILFFLFLANRAITVACIPLTKCGPPGFNIENLNFANNITICLFHLCVFGLTVRYTWNQRIAHSNVKDTGISALIFNQGVFQFFIIFAWTLELAITQKLLRPSISNIDFILRNSIAAVLLCNFHLVLHAQNDFTFGSHAGDGSRWRSSLFHNIHPALHRAEESIFAASNDGDPGGTSTQSSGRGWANNGEIDHHGKLCASESFLDQA